MKKTVWIAAAIALVFTSCREEDFGPQQESECTFVQVDFDRLQVQDAFKVVVEKGNFYSIEAKGDRRNLEDMQVYKSGNTLVIKYDHTENRQYETEVTIVMPDLHGVDFSGATNARVSGFSGLARFDVALSGASMLQANVASNELVASVNGASQLILRGSGQMLNATLTGASLLSGFEFPVEQTTLNISGASAARVSSSQRLQVSASGASVVTYRGQPQLVLDLTGASTVKAD